MPDQNPPTIEYRHPETSEPSSFRRVVSIVLLIGLALFFGSAFVTPVGRPRESANRVKCASNLRQIGQAIQLYAQANAGAFPSDIPALLSAGTIGLDVICCPSASDEKATSIAQAAQPTHCSYLYVGSNLTVSSDPECIVALDDPANHNLKGSNVLFADGHAEFINLPQVVSYLQSLAAGQNPPTSKPSALSQPTAEKIYKTQWQSRMPQLKSGRWLLPSTRAVESTPHPTE